jgi:hypothetical protein
MSPITPGSVLLTNPSTSAVNPLPLRRSVSVDERRIHGCTRGDSFIRNAGSPSAGTARMPSFQ